MVLLAALFRGPLRAPPWARAAPGAAAAVPRASAARRQSSSGGGGRASSSNSSGGGSSSTEKKAGSAQQKRAQSLRLMTAGLVSLASAFIIMRAQATGKTKRSLEQAQAEARAALQDRGGQKRGSGER
jgi:hypothetical protein